MYIEGFYKFDFGGCCLVVFVAYSNVEFEFFLGLGVNYYYRFIVFAHVGFCDHKWSHVFCLEFVFVGAWFLQGFAEDPISFLIYHVKSVFVFLSISICQVFAKEGCCLLKSLLCADF